MRSNKEWINIIGFTGITEEVISDIKKEARQFGFDTGFVQGKNEFPAITHRNYLSTVRRGLITPETTFQDFIDKMREETDELAESYNIGRASCEFDVKELADKALVCFAMAEHYGIDLIDEMRKKTEFNEKRKD